MPSIEAEVKDNSLRRTAVDIGLTFGRQFLAGFMQLGIFLIVARLLGPEGAGKFAVALLLPTLMAKLLNLGLVAANVYFVASKRFPLEQAWASSRDLILAVALVGLGLGTLFIFELGDRAFPGLEQSVLLAALLIFPFSLLSALAIGVFQALQDFRTFNIAVLVQPSLALLGMISLWVFGEFSLLAVMILIVVSHLLGLIIVLQLLSRKVSVTAPAKIRLEYLRPALSFGAKAHLSNILTFLNYRLDLFIVNLVVGPAMAGVYAVAVRMAEQLWMMSQAASTVLMPLLSAMHSDEAEQRNFTPVMARGVMWVTLFGAGVLAALSRPLIDLLFGPEFALANTTLIVLLPGIVLFACARVLANDVAARGLVSVNLALAGAVLVLNTTANLLLIPTYGVLGAASATTFAYTTALIASLIIQRHITDEHWRSFVLPTPQDIQLFKRAMRKRKKHRKSP